jgi:type II secretory pathway component PulK
MGSTRERRLDMKPSRKSGQALLLVMWAMFVMCFSILGLMRLLNVTISTASSMERVSIASSLAYAGTTIGKNEDFPPNGKPSKRQFPNGSELEITAVSENGKLNINTLLAAQDRTTLRALLRIWGLNDVEADTVLDCLLDYVEPGTTRRLNGAKAEQYRLAGRQPPSGKLFRSVDEMQNVLHFDMVTKKKDNWRDYFTIYGDGTLDLTTAPPDLIKAVCRVGDSSARGLAQAMTGEGRSIQDLEAARIAMGLTEKEFQELASRISMGGKVRRIRAKATFGQATRSIEMIFRMDTSTILDWREW